MLRVRTRSDELGIERLIELALASGALARVDRGRRGNARRADSFHGGPPAG